MTNYTQTKHIDKWELKPGNKSMAIHHVTMTDQLFVHIMSWEPEAPEGNLLDIIDAGKHEDIRKFINKKIKVTIEVLDDEKDNTNNEILL